MKYYKDLFLKSWKEFIELIGLIFSVIVVFQGGLNWLSIIFLFVILLSIVVAIYSIYQSYREIYANAYYSTSDINEYMHNWLEDNSRSIIFSRDMSWANDDGKIFQVLEKKALDKELILVLADKTPLVTKLEAKGAVFIEYGFLGYTPKTRFTFVNYESMDEKVAIGKQDENGVHRIDEYSPSDAPVYYLARDLISILIKMDKIKGLK